MRIHELLRIGKTPGWLHTCDAAFSELLSTQFRPVCFRCLPSPHAHTGLRTMWPPWRKPPRANRRALPLVDADDEATEILGLLAHDLAVAPPPPRARTRSDNCLQQELASTLTSLSTPPPLLPLLLLLCCNKPPDAAEGRWTMAAIGAAAPPTLPVRPPTPPRAILFLSLSTPSLPPLFYNSNSVELRAIGVTWSASRRVRGW
jgi:hypothetical protein